MFPLSSRYKTSRLLRNAGLVAGTLALATGAAAQIIAPEKLAADAQQALAAGRDPIPGPRTCFWARGPASADPYINIAYPDSATFYRAAVFTVPQGAKLSFEGKFPHSRYMSFISYDQAGRPIESVADYLIKPKAGSVNPFLPGADRTAANREYSLDVVDGRPPASQPIGMSIVGQTRDKLHTPKYGPAPGQQTILYRIYVVDKGTDETAGAGLPLPVLTLADGKVLNGADTCQALRMRQPLQLDAAAMAVPMVKYHELLAEAAKKSPVFPAA